MSDLDEFYVHTATVEKYLGRTGSGGESWVTGVDKAGFLDDERRLILSATGEQIVSSSVWYTDLADADLYVFKSKVTANGRTAQVLEVKRRDGGTLDLPDHLEVSLT